MEIAGRTTIHPLVFYSGKLSGYLTWVLLGLDYLGVRAIRGFHASVLDYLNVCIDLVPSAGLQIFCRSELWRISVSMQHFGRKIQIVRVS
jgi:hypothetical protein